MFSCNTPFTQPIKLSELLMNQSYSRSWWCHNHWHTWNFAHLPYTVPGWARIQAHQQYDCSSSWQPAISHHFTFNIVNLASLTCEVTWPSGPTGVQSRNSPLCYWIFLKAQISAGYDSIICTFSVTYILIFLHILWYAVLRVGELCWQNWLFKSPYYGMRKPQVWEIMQLNKKNFRLLNSPVVSMSLSLPKCHFSRHNPLAEQLKSPTPKLNGGQHTRMDIM